MPRVVPSSSIVPARPMEAFLELGNVLIPIYLTAPQSPVDILRRLIAKTDRSLNTHVSTFNVKYTLLYHLFPEINFLAIFV